MYNYKNTIKKNRAVNGFPIKEEQVTYLIVEILHLSRQNKFC